jgi:membrane-associated phospholipid phosphatase
LIVLTILCKTTPLLVVTEEKERKDRKDSGNDSDGAQGQSQLLPNNDATPSSTTSINKHSPLIILLTSFFISCATNILLTDSLKRYVGRLRPNFYSICDFNDETHVCDADEHRESEGRMSFPSGHSSITSNGMTFLILYILYTFPARLTYPRYINNIIIYFSILLPLCITFWVATSRLHDNWHHPSDILAGCIIGAISASIGFKGFAIGF